MIEKILNNGFYPENGESLNQKIRISNLVALLSVIVVGLYTPFYFFFSEEPGIVMNLSFWLLSVLNFYLLHKRKYMAGFLMHCTAGYLYFITGTLFYGVAVNLHFYMLVMCMIVTTLFDIKKIIHLYLAFAVVSFFALVWWSSYYEPLVTVAPEMKSIELIIGNINLFLLFFISSLFILFFKTDMIRSQVNILEQKEVIEEKNRDITDSINYAKRIQSALLPGSQNLYRIFPGSFLYFQPKDIVSGDFYWWFESEKYQFVAVGDCTGHGVPGALMSVLGINLLTEIVENKQIHRPAEILNELRKGIINAFDKEGKSSEYKDGMDIALIRISKSEKTYLYAASNNPIYHIRGGVLTELKADRQAVGYSHEMKNFTEHSGTYEKGDNLVLFTDGFADQFGGLKNKKFMYKPYKELLLKNLENDTEKILHATLSNWRGENEQVDDVTVLGIKL